MESLYRRLSRDKLHLKAADMIQDLVIRNKLRPGDRLPSQRQLADQLGVSRNVVREAIAVLQERGLVQVTSGRGSIISDLVTEGMHTSLNLAFQTQGSSLQDLQEVREALEVDIAGLAADRATPDDVNRLRSAVETMDACMELPERFVEADLEFHSALARATQNKLFLVLINPIVDLLRDARLLQFDAPGSPARGQESHKTILRCVELHDREGAQRAMQAHLKVMTESVLRAIGVPQARGNR